jgi:hypothetical protein
LVLTSVNMAWADAIDGDWCNGKGRHLSIKGPDIVTPSGTNTTGNYSRHAFSYTTPPTEPSAGTTVHMQLLNELTMHLTIGADGSAPVEVWNRCEPVS